MNIAQLKLATTFGQQLINTGDLDPVYIALAKSGVGPAELARIIVAYSCNYHLSSAAYIAQYNGQKFWDKLAEAAVNEGLKWPRGSERRHWRGKASVEGTQWISARYSTPETLVAYWATGSVQWYTGLKRKQQSTFVEVFKRVQELPYYGPWIAFKVADLLERVMGYPVDFSSFELGVYEEPRKGAALLLTGCADTKITDAELNLTVTALLKELGPLKAPPARDRRINIQEAETVLCKYKSHVGGHYPPGKDTLEVLHGLKDDRFQCTTVRRMREVIEPMAREWGVE